MKRNIHKSIIAIAVFSAVVTTVRADWSFSSQPNSYPYDFGPSAIVPKWSEVNVGEWTFNYEGALAKAKAEGKYTLMLFTGSWWCPHCQALERDVLVKDGFKNYVAEKGYYLAALDFPYRDGHSMWTWLWDPAYRAANGIGDWTPQQIADEYAKRFEYQGLMHTEGGVITTNNNVLVEISADGSTTNFAVYAQNPTTIYRRVAYATIVVIDPDGNEVGRVKYDKKISPSEGLGMIINEIETIKMGGSTDLFASPMAGGIEGTAAQTYDAVLTDAKGVVAGVVTFKTARRHVRTGDVKVTCRIQMAGGRRMLLTGTAEGSEGEKISLSGRASSLTAIVRIGAEGVMGSCTDGESTYAIQGARKPFRARDDAAKARAASLQKGFWTFALADSGKGGSSFTRGYSTFSVTTTATGKAKVVGFLGDGSRVALSSQVLLGENGKMLVPVIGKKGGFSMLLKFDDGKISAVIGVSGWKTAVSTGEWAPDAVFDARSGSGAGAVPDTMYLQIEGFNPAAGLGGKAVAVSPVGDAVASNGRTWTGTKGVTDLKVTFNQEDGTFKGAFYVSVTEGGRSKRLRAAVNGVVVNGVPHGTAVMRNVGAWAVKFTR